MSRSSLIVVVPVVVACSLWLPVACLIPAASPGAAAEASADPHAEAQARADAEQPYALAIPEALPHASVLLEAEVGKTTGSVSAPSSVLHTPGAEASARRFVSLAPGQSVSWQMPISADSIVARVSYPDSTDGAGRDGTLDVRVAEHSIAILPVTSRYSWDYGAPAWGSQDVWSSEPRRGLARHFWDESALKLPAPIASGATLTLLNPAASGQTVLVDFVELEAVPAPLPAPENSLSFATYSPAADGVTDDTQKLERALADAAQRQRTLYVPPGKYRIDSVELNEGSLQGAGLWHTRFVGPHAQIHFMGGVASVSDFAIFGETAKRNDQSDDGNAFAGRPGDGSTLARVWVEHMKCAFWVARAGEARGPTRLRITDCRFRDLMADAVNFCNGTTDSMVDNTQVRNSGDDSLAAWSPVHGGPPGGHNTFAYDSIVSPWVANGIALYGGGPFRVLHNTVRDTVTTGSGIYVAASFDSHPFLGRLEIADNTLLRTGAHESDMGGPTGAIRLLAGERDMAAEFMFRNNTVLAPLESAISVHGPHVISGLRFDGLIVEDAPYLVDLRPGARGAATLTQVTSKGANSAEIRGVSGLFKLTR